MTKVSVIIPCYNHGKYINETVQSVLDQTYDNLQIIIVDDGSSDIETINVLKKIKSDKITVYFNENHGVSYARNYAIEKSHGDYIFPLDADDTIEPTYIEQAVKILDDNSDIGVVYCKANFFGDKTGLWNQDVFSFKEMLLKNLIFVSSLFRKKHWKDFGGFNENMTDGLEDYDFWLYFLELGLKVYKIDEVLFNYRIIKKSRSSFLDLQKNIKMKSNIFRNHSQLYLDNIECLYEEIYNKNSKMKRFRNLYYQNRGLLFFSATMNIILLIWIFLKFL